jgi:hypothetical protein
MVPYIFSNVPGGSSIPLSQLDGNFSYLTSGNPVFLGLTLTGNLSVGGATTFTGPVTANDLAVNGSLTIDGTTINPTGITGTGLLVFNTNPTLVTPILGTPASGNLANCTNLPVAQVAGLAPGILPFLTNPTTANLGAAVVDETGTGNLVLSNNPTLTSPTFVAPILGTPASGNLSLCTGYPAPSLSGVVQVANGGTGMSTTGAVGDSLVVTAPGVLGYSAAPPASGIAGGAASQLLYQSAPNTTAFIPNGTIGQPLVSNGAAAPAWGQISLTAAVTGALPIANGGTNSVNQQGAINNLAGSTANATYLRGNGTNVLMSAIQASDVPILNQNTTGSAATFTSTNQNSQFNSIGVNTAPSGIAGQINATGNIISSSSIIDAYGNVRNDVQVGTATYPGSGLVTGIPSFAKKITLAVSITTTTSCLIQLGTSGGLITTGYSSSSNFISIGGTTSTSGFLMYTNGTAANWDLTVDIVLVNGNTWVASYLAVWDGVYTMAGSGSINVGSAITQVSLTGPNGGAVTVYAS